MQLLKKENGCALFLNADELHFVKYNGTSPTLIFVLGLLGFILFMNGIFQVILGNVGLGSVLLVFGLIPGLLVWQLIKARRKSVSILKPTAENTILVIDTCEKDFYTGKRIHLGHISECSLTYNFQMTSSAKSLILQHPNGKLEIVKGNPFGGKSKPFYSELKKFDLI